MSQKLIVRTVASAFSVIAIASFTQRPAEAQVITPRSAIACVTAMKSCAEELAEDAGLDCLEAAGVDEVDAGVVDGEINAVCASDIIDDALDCATAVSSCGTTSTRRSREYVQTVSYGSNKIGAASDIKCGGDLLVSELVLGTAVINGKRQLTRIEMVCSDGSTYTVGKNFGDQTNSIACTRGSMIAGLNITLDSQYLNLTTSTTEYNTRIMALSTVCEVFSTGVVYPYSRQVGGSVGTTSGQFDANHVLTTRTTKCPSGRQLAGLRVRRDTTGYTYLQSIRGLSLYCK